MEGKKPFDGNVKSIFSSFIFKQDDVPQKEFGGVLQSSETEG